MEIKTFTVGPIDENLYVVSDSTGEAAIIDCGCFLAREWDDVKNYIDSTGLTPTHLLATHLHFDHILGCGMAMRDFGLTLEASPDDYYLYSTLHEQIAMFFGERFADKFDVSFTSKDLRPLNADELISFGNTSLRVIPTPGHTRGGLCFYDETDRILFSGDSLMRGSIGRTDLPGGDYPTLVRSLNERITVLPPDTLVYSGHGDVTTIGGELNYNPFL